MVFKNCFGFSKIFKKKLTLLKYFLYKEKQEQKTNKQKKNKTKNKNQKTNKQKLQITIKLITPLTIQAVLYIQKFQFVLDFKRLVLHG